MGGLFLITIYDLNFLFNHHIIFTWGTKASTNEVTPTNSKQTTQITKQFKSGRQNKYKIDAGKIPDPIRQSASSQN